MQTAKTSATATVIHAVRNGRVLCGARAAAPATGGERPCKRCVHIVERSYEPMPSTPDHWLWDTYAGIARDLNVNWGPQAHPVILDRAERAEWEAMLLDLADWPQAPGTVRWVRHLSDSALMHEVECRTAPTPA